MRDQGAIVRQLGTFNLLWSVFHEWVGIAQDMWRQEGVKSFYKGITPRVLRVAPGQAIVFAVYERVRKVIETIQGSDDDLYSE